MTDQKDVFVEMQEIYYKVMQLKVENKILLEIVRKLVEKNYNPDSCDLCLGGYKEDFKFHHEQNCELLFVKRAFLNMEEE